MNKYDVTLDRGGRISVVGVLAASEKEAQQKVLDRGDPGSTSSRCSTKRPMRVIRVALRHG